MLAMEDEALRMDMFIEDEYHCYVCQGLGAVEDGRRDKNLRHFVPSCNKPLFDYTVFPFNTIKTWLHREVCTLQYLNHDTFSTFLILLCSFEIGP